MTSFCLKRDSYKKLPRPAFYFLQLMDCVFKHLNVLYEVPLCWKYKCVNGKVNFKKIHFSFHF